MNVELLVPQVRSADLQEVVALLSEPGPSPAPFSDGAIDLCAGFSQAIFRDREASKFPELLALAFWMRKAELLRLRTQFQAISQSETIEVPRGLVFHIPPSNVDTIFVYSWLLAVLMGNRNCIRMSSRRAPQSEILLRLMRESLERADPSLQQNTFVLSYGHDSEITKAMSMICDVRVIWGGDQTVEMIREVPLAVHAREMTFPDRSSLGVIRAGAYLALTGENRDKLAERFFNDAYWFDQMACSSPRLLVWCGNVADAQRASEAFWVALDNCIGAKGFSAPAAIHMKKLVFSCESIVDLPVSEYRHSRDVTVLTLESLTSFTRDHSGGGLFFNARIDRLNDLVPALTRKDQTLTYFGFDFSELKEFATSIGGKAVDRMVPFGQALQFGRFWDGQDLLREFCRIVHIPQTPSSL
ncbi:MAG TPA: acyl-CoA reductase [Candidatus Angelobacter sp.]|nr:acyl-CoA reductase [Candidatus Angelobacter sp.]